MTALRGLGRIPLKRKDGSVRAWALVDLADLPRALERTWYLMTKGYVASHVPGSSPKQKEMLHRFIMGSMPGDGTHTDHRNRNRLDNRRVNLRTITQAQNNQNMSGWPNATSGYRGVHRVRSGKWRATATVDYVPYHLGTFDDELEAARVAAEFRQHNMPYNVERRPR